MAQSKQKDLVKSICDDLCDVPPAPSYSYCTVTDTCHSFAYHNCADKYTVTLVKK